MSESHELLVGSSDPFARGPASARLGTGRAASCAAQKGVTAGALIFLGFRSPLQFADPKACLFCLGRSLQKGGQHQGVPPHLCGSGRERGLCWGHRGPVVRLILVTGSLDVGRKRNQRWERGRQLCPGTEFPVRASVLRSVKWSLNSALSADSLDNVSHERNSKFSSSHMF